MSIDIRIEPDDLVGDITSYEREELLGHIIGYESTQWALCHMGSTEDILELLDRDEVAEWADDNLELNKDISVSEIYEQVDEMETQEKKALLLHLFKEFL